MRFSWCNSRPWIFLRIFRSIKSSSHTAINHLLIKSKSRIVRNRWFQAIPIPLISTKYGILTAFFFPFFTLCSSNVYWFCFLYHFPLIGDVYSYALGVLILKEWPSNGGQLKSDMELGPFLIFVIGLLGFCSSHFPVYNGLVWDEGRFLTCLLAGLISVMFISILSFWAGCCDAYCRDPSGLSGCCPKLLGKLRCALTLASSSFSNERKLCMPVSITYVAVSDACSF